MNTAERKIKEAFGKSAQYHREGLDPNDAIVKAANLEQLNPEMVKRVIEMFNISKTNETLKVASDKTSSFPIAQPDIILDRVFRQGPLCDKTAEPEVIQDDFVVVRNFLKAAAMEPEPVNMDISGWIQATQGLMDEANHKLAELQTDLHQAEKKSFEGMQAVIEFFSTTNNVGKWAAFEGDILSEYGDQAKIPLETIYDLSGLEESRFDGTIGKYAFHFERTPIHDAFDQFVGQADRFGEIHLEREKLGVDVQQHIQEHNNILFQLFDIAPKPASKVADLLDFNGAERKQAFFKLPMQATAEKGMESALGGSFQAAHEHAIKQQHQGPRDEVDIEKDNIRRQAILRELMTNDENLIGAQPDQLQSAYNVLLHLAPDATLNHGVTQSFLRSALAQQTVDPFTAKQIADLQNTIMQNKQLTAGNPKHS